MDIKKLADEYLKWFEWKERDDKKEFATLKDGHPAKLKELVRAAHEEMFPDDYKYEFIEEALRAIVDNDDIDDIQLEADAYNNELLKWLSSNLERAGYVEEAVQEYGIDGKDFNLYNVIALGQLREKEEVLGIVRSELEKIAEKEEGPQVWKCIIRKFAYLKTPLYSWTAENDIGGSFNNSGMHKSERACLRDLQANVSLLSGTPVHRYDVDAEGRETFIKTLEVQ